MATVHSYIHSYEHFHATYARVLSITLLAIIVLLVGTYGYLLKATTFSAAAWEDHESSIASVSTRVATLEQAYFDHISKLTITEAHDAGLEEAGPIVFVSRPEAKTALRSLSFDVYESAQ